MDRDDLNISKAKEIIKDLNELILKMKKNKLNISSWYGVFDIKNNPMSLEVINRGYGYKKLEECVDDMNFPWFLYWEIIWILMHANFKRGEKILDLGGSSSLFSYYLASKGFEVVTVDLQRELVENANFVAQEMNWNLKNFVMDMRDLNFSEKFDHITSICVYEHIPMYDRVEINKKIKELLNKGGKFSITFDFKNPSKLARISTANDVYEQFVHSSGLKIRGNDDFYDNNKNYLLHPFHYRGHRRTLMQILRYKKKVILEGQFNVWDFFRTKDKNEYTFGALFLENK